jgi:hypothetical protein
MTSTPSSIEAVGYETKEMETSKHVEYDQEIEPEFTWTPEEEKKLVRKIDLYLLPCIWFMYLLSYMDRTK